MTRRPPKAAWLAVAIACAAGPALAQVTLPSPQPTQQSQPQSQPLPPGFVEAEGVASIPSGDRVRARRLALEEAFRRAIDEAAVAVVDEAQRARRAAAVRVKIDPRARDYITTYRVLDEGEQDGSYHVRLAAQVAVGRIDHDLGPAPGSREAAPSSTLLCLAASGPAGDLAPELAALRDDLVARGIDARIGSASCAPRPGSPQDDLPSDKALFAAARAASAQAALAGTVRYAPSGIIRGTPLVTARAHVRLRLFDVEQRRPQLLGEAISEQEGYGADATEAGQAAVRATLLAAVGALSTPLARRFPQAAEGGADASGGPDASDVVVRLDGMDHYSDLHSLERLLRALPGVSSVEPRRFLAGLVDFTVRGEATVDSVLAGLARTGAGRYVASRAADGSISVQEVRLPPAPPSGPAGVNDAPEGTQPWATPAAPPQGSPR